MSTGDGQAAVLQLTLHDYLVGYLIGYKNGRNILVFANSFSSDAARPTFSLITHPNFPHSTKVMAEAWKTNQRLHPVLSNLLPEGMLRQLTTQALNIHIDDEFSLFSYLANDLPGAIIAKPVSPELLPDSIYIQFGELTAPDIQYVNQANKFSLAGIQMKFSMKEQQGRFTLASENSLGDWIVKTPSIQHKQVPLNEFTAMSLANLVDVNIPEIKLVELSNVENFPLINMADEKWAYAIKRFDRVDAKRIHMEDFAQVLVKYPHQKYNSANYEQIAKVIYQYSGNAIADVQQFARRLLVNILLANGDAHLKNWSLVYEDKITPRLSPAYDIVTTNVYIDDENQYALNLAKTKKWYQVSYSHFESWAQKAGISWRLIKPHLNDVMDKARSLWPQALDDLPMIEKHKNNLKTHWNNLHNDFKI